MEYVVVGCRCIVGAVFVASAMSKLMGAAAFSQFVASLRHFGVPSSWRRLVAAAVAAIEAVIPFLLLVPVTSPAGFLAAIGLLGTFTAVIVRAVRGGVHAPCRCFGSSKAPLGVSHVVRNTLLAAVAFLGAIGTLTSSRLGLDPGGVAVTVATGFVLAGLMIAFDDLVKLFARSSPTASRTGG